VAQLADDAQVAPPWVLGRQAEHDLAGLVGDGRAAQLGVGPAATHQIAMPTQDRGRGDHKRRPSNPGKQTRQQRQGRSIRGLKVQSAYLTAQDLELMSQDRDLHILRDTGSEPATEEI